jgi:hypothetical protein
METPSASQMTRIDDKQVSTSPRSIFEMNACVPHQFLLAPPPRVTHFSTPKGKSAERLL